MCVKCPLPLSDFTTTISLCNGQQTSNGCDKKPSDIFIQKKCARQRDEHISRDTHDRTVHLVEHTPSSFRVISSDTMPSLTSSMLSNRRKKTLSKSTVTRSTPMRSIDDESKVKTRQESYFENLLLRLCSIVICVFRVRWQSAGHHRQCERTLLF
jgi:hypothetical protein